MCKAFANIALECYSYVLVTITTLWFGARQPNLTANVEQYMHIHVIYSY